MSFTKSLSIKHIDSENKLRIICFELYEHYAKKTKDYFEKQDKKDKPWITYSHKNDNIKDFFFPFLAGKHSSCFYSSVRKLNAPFWPPS